MRGDVGARVRLLAARDAECARFGADTHRYALRPPLPEAEIRRFEAAHGIALPPAYRAFVAEAGDGPAGPGHGLMPLTEPRAGVDDDWAVDAEWREDRQPGRLATPFALTEPLRGPLRALPESLTPGTLTLSELGCGTYDRLVLTGPHAGEIWHLDPDWAGFVPRHADFRSWYEEWLNAV
ncbi:SMI1/KNR4 family protein [Streptomyces sp. NPDC101160]|uniref:SMI1/KNR4 family protein n=1 Tax=Streptomyces sp. NPDC101160 TaxID=3366118 RepID=UPI0038133267